MTKTYCRQELALVIAACLGGSITSKLLAAALKDCDPRVASGVLKNLVAAGALTKFEVVGGHGLNVWLTTRAYEKGAKAGIKNFTTRGKLCMPPPEWWHDQLAARFTLLFADTPDVALLEHEMRRWDQSGLPRLADGVFRHTYSPESNAFEIVATEVEISRKTGLNGGWAKLAASMIDRMNGAGEVVSTWHKRVEATVVIAPWPYMKAIRARVRHILERRWKQGHDGPIETSVLTDVWWWWIDLDKPNSNGLLMSAIDDRTEESSFLGYDALQQRRSKDPVRQARAFRAQLARNATILEAKSSEEKQG